jgi:hypothetical protein
MVYRSISILATKNIENTELRKPKIRIVLSEFSVFSGAKNVFKKNIKTIQHLSYTIAENSQQIRRVKFSLLLEGYYLTQIQVLNMLVIMIEKTTILQFMQTSTAQPVSEKELMRSLQVNPDDRPRFKKFLRELIASGDLLEGKKGRVGLPEQMGYIVGYVQAHPNGFGFVVPKVKGEPDLYISKNELGNAFHGDLVVASIKRKRAGRLNEGTIVRILQRGKSRIIGSYQDLGDYGLVIPDVRAAQGPGTIDAIAYSDAGHASPNRCHNPSRVRSRRIRQIRGIPLSAGSNVCIHRIHADRPNLHYHLSGFGLKIRSFFQHHHLRFATFINSNSFHIRYPQLFHSSIILTLSH